MVKYPFCFRCLMWRMNLIPKRHCCFIFLINDLSCFSFSFRFVSVWLSASFHLHSYLFFCFFLYRPVFAVFREEPYISLSLWHDWLTAVIPDENVFIYRDTCSIYFYYHEQFPLFFSQCNMSIWLSVSCHGTQGWNFFVIISLWNECLIKFIVRQRENSTT